MGAADQNRSAAETYDLPARPRDGPLQANERDRLFSSVVRDTPVVAYEGTVSQDDPVDTASPIYSYIHVYYLLTFALSYIV